jgi:hypothetical protein
VLDAQGLSLPADTDRRMMARLELAMREEFMPMISAITIVGQSSTRPAADCVS